MQVYEIVVIEDDELPAAQEWALVQDGKRTVLLVKQGVHGPRVMAEAWAAFRRLDRANTPDRLRRVG